MYGCVMVCRKKLQQQLEKTNRDLLDGQKDWEKQLIEAKNASAKSENECKTLSSSNKKLQRELVSLSEELRKEKEVLKSYFNERASSQKEMHYLNNKISELELAAEVEKEKIGNDRC